MNQQQQQYHPACGHKGSSHLSPVHALQFFYRDASSALLQLVNQWLNFTYSRSHAFRYEHKFYFGKNRTHDFRTSRGAGYLLDHSGDERLHRRTHPPSYTAGPTPLPTPRDPPPPLHRGTHPLPYTAGPTPLPTPRDPPPFLHRGTHPPSYTAGPTPLPTPRDPPPSLHRGTPPPPTPRAPPHQNYD